MTAAFIALRRIDPVDGLVYILAQLSGGVLGALMTKWLLLDEGRASDYGVPQVSATWSAAPPRARRSRASAPSSSC